MGLTLGAFAFLGGAIGPIISTGLFARFGWRAVFFIYAVPAVLMGIAILLFLREPASTLAAIKARKEGRGKRLDAQGREVRYADIFKNRNVILLALIWIVQMTWDVQYLRRYVSRQGAQATCNYHGYPHDWLRCRNPLWWSPFRVSGRPHRAENSGYHHPDGRRNFRPCVCIFAAGYVFDCDCRGHITLLWYFGGAGGALTTMGIESVGPLLAATAAGFINGIGELVGGGIFPTIGGSIADWLGLSATLYVTGAISIAGGVVACFLRETLERRKGTSRTETFLAGTTASM